jgi:hypothetical protein
MNTAWDAERIERTKMDKKSYDKEFRQLKEAVADAVIGGDPQVASHATIVVSAILHTCHDRTEEDFISLARASWRYAVRATEQAKMLCGCDECDECGGGHSTFN